MGRSNLITAAQSKIEVNEQKYPVEKVKGSAKKYTEYIWMLLGKRQDLTPLMHYVIKGVGDKRELFTFIIDYHLSPTPLIK